MNRIPWQIVFVGLLAGAVAGPGQAQPQFDPPLRLNASDAVGSDGVRIAAGPDGTWLASWSETILSSRVAVYSRSEDNGASWTAPALLGTEGSPADYVPSIATDGHGTWIAVWAYGDGIPVGVLASTSLDAGATWSAPTVVAQFTTFSAVLPELVTDGVGRWAVIWYLTGIEEEIMVSRSVDKGATWSAPAVLHTGPILTHPRLGASGNGTFLATWSSDLVSTIYPEDINIARSTDAGATWSAAEKINTDAFTATGINFLPTLASDDAGSWIVTWSASGPLPATDGTDIVAARSDDDGLTWGEAVLVSGGPNTGLGANLHPHVASGGGHRWVIAWESQAPSSRGFDDTDYDLYVSESVDGGLSWGLSSALNAAATIDAVYDDDRYVHLQRGFDGSWKAAWLGITDQRGQPHDHLEPVILVASAPVSSGDGSTPCFVATAAFGTPLASELDRLRAWRDERWLRSATGAAFVDAYYRIGPSLARWIAPRPAARSVSRLVLEVFLAPGASAFAMAGGIALSIVIAMMRTGRRVRAHCP